MIAQHIPPAEELEQIEYNLTDLQVERVCRIIDNLINLHLSDFDVFNSCTDEVKDYTISVFTNASKWYIQKYSRRRFDNLLLIPVYRRRNDSDFEMVYIIDDDNVIIEMFTFHLFNNFFNFGTSTENWYPITEDIVRDFDNNHGLIVPLSPRRNRRSNRLNNVLLQSFEENREETIDKIYGEHQNHKLIFSELSSIKRNEDIDECKLCYEKSDYVCEQCKYPLCSDCIMHLKKSTNKCPACQAFPIKLQRVENGNYKIEQNDDEQIDDKQIDEQINSSTDEQINSSTDEQTNSSSINENVPTSMQNGDEQVSDEQNNSSSTNSSPPPPPPSQHQNLHESIMSHMIENLSDLITTIL